MQMSMNYYESSVILPCLFDWCVCVYVCVCICVCVYVCVYV